MIDINDYLPKRNRYNDLYTNNKGYSKEYISFLINNNLYQILDIFKSTKTKEEYLNKLKNALKNGEIEYINKNIILYETYNTLFTTKDIINNSLAYKYLNNKINHNNIFNIYSDTLTIYIQDNNFIKNSFYNYTGNINYIVSDYTKPFTKETLVNYYKLLFVNPNTYQPKERLSILNNQNILADILFKLETVYDKDTLLNKKELVSFEILYGYFDKYYTDIENNKKIPSIEERLNTFNKEHLIPRNILYIIKNIDILINRIDSLEDENKYYYLDLLNKINNINDQNIVIDNINKCLNYYELQYRKELINSLYNSNNEEEITDYSQLKPLLLHTILRDPLEKFLPDYEQRLKQEIISKRTKVIDSTDLTEEEIKIFNKQRLYAIKELLNPFVTEKYLNTKTIHTGKNNKEKWYQSNTSNQLSVSLYSPETLLNMDNCIGMGFDSNSLSPDNIAISSNVYLTTNKGLDNLEILPSKRFNLLSSPLKELSQNKKTELVLYRNINGKEVKCHYVFVIVNGIDNKKDEELIEKGRQYAKDNNLPLQIFRLKELRKSYIEQINNEFRI